MYAGYYPSGLALRRIFDQLPGVPFREHVRLQFMRSNAARLLKIDD